MSDNSPDYERLACLADLEHRPEDSAALRAAAALARENARLNERNVELSINGYGWMARHDKLLGFVQSAPDMLKRLIENDPRGPCPSPMDIPNLVQRAESAESANREQAGLLTEAHDLNQRLQLMTNGQASKIHTIESANRALQAEVEIAKTLNVQNEEYKEMLRNECSRLKAEVDRLNRAVEHKNSALAEVADTLDREIPGNKTSPLLREAIAYPGTEPQEKP